MKQQISRITDILRRDDSISGAIYALYRANQLDFIFKIFR